MSEASERHLKSIDVTLKKILAKIDGEKGDASLVDVPRRLTEPEWAKLVGAAAETTVAGEREVKRLTEPGEPVTGGEGEYLLPTDDKVGE